MRLYDLILLLLSSYYHCMCQQYQLYLSASDKSARSNQTWNVYFDPFYLNFPAGMWLPCSASTRQSCQVDNCFFPLRYILESVFHLCDLVPIPLTIFAFLG